jgi:hypothetical protein
MLLFHFWLSNNILGKQGLVARCWFQAMSTLSNDPVVIEFQGIQQFIIAQSKVTDVSSLKDDQCQHIVKRLGLISVNVQRATLLTETFQDGPWTGEQKGLLAKAVQDRLMVVGVGTRDAASRRKNQTLNTFESYLTDQELSDLQDTRTSACLFSCVLFWFGASYTVSSFVSVS